MKKGLKLTSLILVLIFLTVNIGFCSREQGKMSDEDKKKPPSEAMKIIEKMNFKPLKCKVPRVGKEIERVVLPNGMILYMMEDHTLPRVKIYGIIRTGEIYETKDKHGVADITGKVMRSGGTKFKKPGELNEELEFIAADVETQIGAESGSIYLFTISSQLDKSLKLFADVLRYPAFAQKELDLAKSQLKEKIRRQNDDVFEIGHREFYNLLYGDHPVGWKWDWDVIKKINRSDLIAWHSRFYKPTNMMFAIVGDFDKKEMIKKFNKLFGDWKKEKVDFPKIKKVKKEYHPGIYFAVKENVNQSYIRAGHLGIKRTNPDKYAIKVMNFILGGGGFSSMMTEKIRSDEGLAYMVFSYFKTDNRDLGNTGTLCTTKSKSTVRVINLIQMIIRKMQSQNVSQAKLKWAKDSTINGFVFEFGNPGQQVNKLMMLEYNNMPRDYYEKYLDNIQKVTVEDVQRVAKKYLDPDKMTILVVGNPKDFDKPLKSTGIEVKEIKLEDMKE
ncbi:MAG: insulinase family protein [Candidatus Eremiobacteraeota bacterium]|nr:insulinase family protein [Candidatus Eremiobacteraeota bacterium]